MKNHTSTLTCAAVAGLLVVAAAAPPSTAADYANRDMLTSAAQLAAMIDRPDLRIVDVRPAEAYQAGHIPGAVHLSADAVIDPASHVDGDLLPFGQLAAMLGARGIGKDTRVILYDDRGGFHASRLFWMLEHFGHQQVSLLNGGLPMWEAQGQPISTEMPMLSPAQFDVTLMPRRAASADWLLDRRDAPNVVVIDVRPAGMFAEGHIPWAQNIPWKRNLAEDATLRSADELMAQFAAEGVTPDKNVAVHCQNGKAAAHSYFTLRLLGYPRVRSYDRSWAEWGTADDLPKASEQAS